MSPSTSRLLAAIGSLFLAIVAPHRAPAQPTLREAARWIGFNFAAHEPKSPAGDNASPAHVFVHRYPLPDAGFVTAVRFRSDRDGARERTEQVDLLILRPVKGGWDVVQRVKVRDDQPARSDKDTVVRLSTPLAVEKGYLFAHWQAGSRGPLPMSVEPHHVEGRSFGKFGFESKNVAVGRFISSQGFTGRRDYFLQLEFQPAGANIAPAARAEDPAPSPAPPPAEKPDSRDRTHRPPVEITKDTVLDQRHRNSRLVIKASDITIDGRGIWLTGDMKAPSNQRYDTAIVAAGVSNVTLKNVNAKGWETGLRVTDGKGWVIENCDFSDNFHDPSFGWGEQGRRGGMILENFSGATIRDCKANRVWDGCVLVGSSKNTIEDCDFSHASNTCLKLWRSSANAIRNNNLSYGLRIKPGEVHARDSACLLIETGSNDNRFENNNCTHGGDGIFIRVLNGVVSTGNQFKGNDCSYAHNNCVEAWSPRNTYIGNKANHGSYGFWLGASDQTVLLDNEASFNGLADGYHNSPHLPGSRHAGIVFMFGSSSHTIVRGNRCRGNNGAGIALIGDQGTRGRKFKPFHWIIEKNLVENTWGVFAEHANWIDMAANQFHDNSLADVHEAGNVTNLVRHPADPAVKAPPNARLAGPQLVATGERVTFDASASADPAGRKLRYRWDLGDGTIAQQAVVEHVFRTPGFHRVGVTVNNGVFSDLAWRDLYVVDDLPELATEGQADLWTLIDPRSKAVIKDDRTVRVAGQASISFSLDPYSGDHFVLQFPAGRNARLSLKGKKHLVFWLKAVNENIPAWQSNNPIVTLLQDKEQYVRLTPRRDLLGNRANNEEREGWSYFQVPLAGDDLWQREGGPIETLNSLTITLDSWGTPPLKIWIDGLSLAP